MKYLFLIPFFVFASSTLFANVTMEKTIPRPSLPIEKPDRPIVRPPHVPVSINPGIVYQDNYYTNNIIESCGQYKKLIDELNDYIDGLEAQIAELKEKEYARQREKLKKQNAEELKQFENRRSPVKTKNQIKITPK